MLSADNLCKQFGPRSGPTKKVNLKKKVSRRHSRQSESKKDAYFLVLLAFLSTFVRPL